MSHRSTKTDAVIDALVTRVNASPREPFWDYLDEVPPLLRLGASSGAGADWRVVQAADPDRATRLELRLPGAFPPSFRSLVNRYLFMPFEVGSIKLFANTDHDLTCDLRLAIFGDKAMFATLSRHGLVQFGRPDTGDYDAICFDLSQRRADKECPVVRVDHETILIDERIRVTQEIAPSFLDLVR